jgi:hypothetical protein
MEAESFHEPLRLRRAHLKRQGTQDGRKQMYATKTAPNPKTRIMTTLHQFRDKAARQQLPDATLFLRAMVGEERLSNPKS